MANGQLWPMTIDKGAKDPNCKVLYPLPTRLYIYFGLNKYIWKRGNFTYLKHKEKHSIIDNDVKDEIVKDPQKV